MVLLMSNINLKFCHWTLTNVIEFEVIFGIFSYFLNILFLAFFLKKKTLEEILFKRKDVYSIMIRKNLSSNKKCFVQFFVGLKKRKRIINIQTKEN